jgi:Ni/Fe-hydrogenase 1 B-type cytochrome subunit
MATTTTGFEAKDFAQNPDNFFRREYVWEVPVRITHWVNAACLLVLFLTGLYISHPILAPSGEAYRHFVMGRVRQIHFIAAMTFVVSFMLRIYWFWLGNNYSRSGFPFVWRASWWRDLFRQVADYLKLERGHVHLGHNSMGGLAYTLFVVALGWAQIFTGSALYSETNPDGFFGRVFGWVIPFLGGSFQTRMWHHTFAWGFVVFAIFHVYIILYDSTQYGNGLITSIISGYKFYKRGDLKNDRWLS